LLMWISVRLGPTALFFQHLARVGIDAIKLFIAIACQTRLNVDVQLGREPDVHAFRVRAGQWVGG
jgi:hypothetical protein